MDNTYTNHQQTRTAQLNPSQARGDLARTHLLVSIRFLLHEFS